MAVSMHHVGIVIVEWIWSVGGYGKVGSVCKEDSARGEGRQSESEC